MPLGGSASAEPGAVQGVALPACGCLLAFPLLRHSRWGPALFFSPVPFPNLRRPSHCLWTLVS